MDSIWLELAPGVSVEVDRAEATGWSVPQFQRFYRRHVLSSSRKEAGRWAREQVRLREVARGQQSVTVPVGFS